MLPKTLFFLFAIFKVAWSDGVTKVILTSLGDAERIQLAKDFLSIKNELLTTPDKQFQAKHLYKSTNNNEVTDSVDSFLEISSSPQTAKEYLQNLHMKLYHDGIFPEADKDQFTLWINQPPLFHIADTVIGDVEADVHSTFTVWKNKQELTPYGTLKPNVFLPTFETRDQHNVTQIRFQVVSNTSTSTEGGTTIEIVEVWAEKLQANLLLQVDENGNAVCLSGLNNSVSLQNERLVTTLSIQELHIIANITKEFWSKFPFSNTGPIVLNENSKTYIKFWHQAQEEYQQEMYKQKSELEQIDKTKLLRFGIQIDGDGNVEFINPTNFLDSYNNSTDQQKHEMAVIVQQNLNKLPIDNDQTENIKRIVTLEELKSHKATLDAVNNIQETSRASRTQDSFKLLEEMHQSIEQLDSNVRLSTTKTARAIASILASSHEERTTESVSASSLLTKTPFLSKTSLNGISRGDTTALALTGSRLLSVSAFGDEANALGKISKLGSIIKGIGSFTKPLNPIVKAFDISFSGDALINSIGRLNNAKNVYDKQDAVADIVYNTLSIAISTVAFGISLVNPVAGFVFGVVVKTILYVGLRIAKAGIEVQRINSEIPLSGSEKWQVGWTTFLGSSRSGYIDDLVDEKRINDVAVQQNLNFLKDNPGILGIVFPARTLYYDGGSRFTRSICGVKNLWGCTTWWEKWRTLETGCDMNKPCSKEHGACKNYWVSTGLWTYNDYECTCDGKMETSFGYPRSNSFVDLREKQRVFWERSVPKDVEGGEFICKPGDKELVDYKLSQHDSRYDYLCERAIGLLQPSYKRHAGQRMVFNLDDGDDTVYAKLDNTPNLFLMGKKGRKWFYGGNGRDEFRFDSPCNGAVTATIDGKAGNDAIVIGNDCTSGNQLSIKCENEVLNFGSNVVIFYQIEELIGRKEQSDSIMACCKIKKIVSSGGTLDLPDLITIPERSCIYDLVVLAVPHTNVTSHATKGSVAILASTPWTAINVEAEVRNQRDLHQTIVLTSVPSSKVHNWSRLNANESAILRVETLDEQIDIKFVVTVNVTDVSVSFAEEPVTSPYSVLQVDEDSTGIFYHALPDLSGNLTRIGCHNTTNVFDVSGPIWNIIGGNMNDEFVYSVNKTGNLNGGKGIDVIKFALSFQDSFTLNLQNGQIQSIENVIGNSGAPLVVITACNTQHVSSNGGNETMFDEILVPASCKNRRLQVFATGYVRVVLENGEELLNMNDTVQILVDSRTPHNLSFQLHGSRQNYDNVLVGILLNHTNWHVVKMEMMDYLIIEFAGKNNEKVELQFQMNNTGNETSHGIPLTQFLYQNQTPGVLEVDLKMEKVTVAFNVNASDVEKRNLTIKGLAGIQNVFRLTNICLSVNATGGNESDLFVVTVSSELDVCNVDGMGGADTIVFEDSNSTENVAMLINLRSSLFRVENQNNLTSSKIHDIEHIYGRANSSDIIWAHCNTLSIDGRSGRGVDDQLDRIYVEDSDCTPELVLTVGRFTAVENSATNGHFTYLVKELETSNFDLLATTNNSHQLKYNVHPWKVIKFAAFDRKNKKLNITFTSNGTDTTHSFIMSKWKDADEYTNPKFQFHPDNSSVSVDINVDVNGHTTTTYTINGTDPHHIIGLPVDVNRFLINITEITSSHETATITGCPEEGNCITNQLWIFNLNQTLKLLDGGECKQCLNSLYFNSNSAHQYLEIDLDIANGTIVGYNKTRLVSKLKNIHELYGLPEMTAYASCQTRKVSNVGLVVVKGKQCDLNISIDIDVQTTVWFESSWNYSLSTTEQSTARYIFTTPVSFDPSGSYHSIIQHNHIYHFSFPLAKLQDLRADMDTDKLTYKINGTDYEHKLLASPGFFEQFYSQPSMFTSDGYRLQISRDGSLWAILVDEYDEAIQPKEMKDLEKMTTRLATTLVISKTLNIYTIGYRCNQSICNVLQTSGGKVNHLCGNSEDKTIYQIIQLENDVVIYTGYDMPNISSNETNTDRQTIDLTDVVVHIRNFLGTKYIPEVIPDDSHLTIRMNGFEKEIPGVVRIVNGTLPWVNKKIQVLLDKAALTMVEVEPNKWKLVPEKVIIPINATSYSLSLDELEDNQSIELESTLKSDNTANNQTQENFAPVKNGTNLLLTNLVTNDASQYRTIIIEGFFETNNGSDKQVNSTGSTTESNQFSFNVGIGITLHLPGLDIMVNGSTILNMTKNETDGTWITEYPPEVVSLDKALHEVENVLLADMPDIQRSFPCNDACYPKSWWHIYSAGISLLVVLVIVAGLGFLYFQFRKRFTSAYSVQHKAEMETSVELQALRGKEFDDE